MNVHHLRLGFQRTGAVFTAAARSLLVVFGCICVYVCMCISVCMMQMESQPIERERERVTDTTISTKLNGNISAYALCESTKLFAFKCITLFIPYTNKAAS